MEDRAALLTAGLPRAGRYVEVGPSHNPLLAKRDGWDVAIVDHLDRAGLVEKYAAHANVDPDAIEEVDHVWHGEPLADLFPPEVLGTYDAVIASHVVEHTTDLVGFLGQASRLIRPDGGQVVLAVPDKRVCFDFFRPVSTTADAIVAHREGRTRHDGRTLFDYVASAAGRAGHISWGHRETRALEFLHPLPQALAMMEAAATSPDYIDAHQWVFTPSSFALILLELRALDLIDLVVDEVREMPGNEFHARLRRGDLEGDDDAIRARRVTLSARTTLELAEQARQISAATLPQTERELRDRLVRTRAQAKSIRQQIVALQGRPSLRGLPARLWSAVAGRF